MKRFSSLSLRACSKSRILALQTPKFYLAGSKRTRKSGFLRSIDRKNLHFKQALKTPLRLFLPALLVFYTGGLCAAPLESGYALAPNASASLEQKAAAATEARYCLLAAAAVYENTPYRFGGLDRKGLDCSGLVYVSFKDALGVSVPRTTGSLYSWAEKIPDEKAQPGDLLFFKTTRGGNISHVGIYAGGGRFIHAASEGPVTGVMYSGLDELYWSSAYADAGRALPEGDINERRLSLADAAADSGGDREPHTGRVSGKGEKAPAKKQAGKGNFSLGVAFAPTWNSFLANGDIIRGFAGHIHLGAKAAPFKLPMIFGLELRPEWDGALGVFRLPLTLSWGPNDKFRIFAGPALSFGDAALAIDGGQRYYSGGTSWLGAAGITIAPVSLKIARGELAPYGEIAWQSYFSDNSGANPGADFAAGFRLSTGIRYTWNL
jgi:probable lipoprotein NlpC